MAMCCYDHNGHVICDHNWSTSTMHLQNGPRAGRRQGQERAAAARARDARDRGAFAIRQERGRRRSWQAQEDLIRRSLAHTRI